MNEYDKPSLVCARAMRSLFALAPLKAAYRLGLLDTQSEDVLAKFIDEHTDCDTAPDLLEAAKHGVFIADLYAELREADGIKAADTFATVLASMKTAIAKATGEPTKD